MRAHIVLQPGQVRPGDTVLCIAVPDMTLFEYSDLFGYDFVKHVPMVGVVYTVRSYSVFSASNKIYQGIHLTTITNPPVYIMGDPRGEPFFELKAFTFFSRKSP